MGRYGIGSPYWVRFQSVMPASWVEKISILPDGVLNGTPFSIWSRKATWVLSSLNL